MWWKFRELGRLKRVYDDDCTETAYSLSEWEVIVLIQMVQTIQNLNLKMQHRTWRLFVGAQYLCLDAPNSPLWRVLLWKVQSDSNLFIDDTNISEILNVSWLESYDSDGHDLFIPTIYTTLQEILFPVRMLQMI